MSAEEKTKRQIKLNGILFEIYCYSMFYNASSLVTHNKLTGTIGPNWKQRKIMVGALRS